MITFTLDEANSLIPELRRVIKRAKDDLSAAYKLLKQTNAELIDREWALRQAKIDGIIAGKTPNELQNDWQSAAEELEAAKTAFGELQDHWISAIAGRGVILRDLQRGLVDFPALLGDAELYYCWAMDEDEIGHWHSRKEGFSNRKPLAALASWDWSDQTPESA